jgi:hypothetical protein
MVTFAKLSHSVWLPFSIAVFLICEIALVGAGDAPVVIAAVMLLGLPLGIMMVKQVKPDISLYALVVYLFLVVQMFLWVSGNGCLYHLFGAVLLFLPLLAIEFVLKVRKKKIPGIGALGLMVLVGPSNFP